MPTHTSAMNAASGSTMPADHSSAGTMLRRLRARRSAIARMTARLVTSRATTAAGDDEEAERDRAVRRHRVMSRAAPAAAWR
jgi:hypothetical protein